jgi:hypothetical protein
MVDLTAAAISNATLRQQDFDAVRANPGVEELAHEVQTNGQVNVGMGAAKLCALLTNGSVPSAWERCGQLSTVSGRPVEDHWAEEQNNHAVRRGAFEEWMQDGRSSHYGALAINNRWVPSYGDFAIELQRPDPKRDVYLPSNSAEDYVHLDGTVQTTDVLRDVTAHEQRHHLTAVKHANDPFVAHAAARGRMLCNEDSFVEAIVPVLISQEVGSVMAKRDLGSILALAITDPTSSLAALPAINAVLAAAHTAGVAVKKSNLDADEVGG